MLYWVVPYLLIAAICCHEQLYTGYSDKKPWYRNNVELSPRVIYRALAWPWFLLVLLFRYTVAALKFGFKLVKLLLFIG